MTGTKESVHRAATASRLVSALAILLLMALATTAYVRTDWLVIARRVVGEMGVGGILLYLLVQTLWSLTTIPSIPWLVVSGVIYGPWLGSVLAVVGIMLGSAATFLIGRYLLSAQVARWRKRYPALDRGLRFAERHEVITLLIARTGPVFPLNLLNYALGATHISLLRYLWVSLLAAIPAAVLYAGLGEALHGHLVQAELSHSTLWLLGAGALSLIALGWAVKHHYHRVGHYSGDQRQPKSHTRLPSSP